jgi:hypothetical protein
MFGNANTMLAGRYGSLIAGVSNQMNGSWNSAVLGEGNIVAAGSQYTKIVGGYFNTIDANTHVTFAFGQSNIIGNATGTLTNNGAGALGGSNTVIGTGSIAIGMNNVMSGTGSYNYSLGYNNQHSGTSDQITLVGTNITAANLSNAVKIAGASQRLGFYNVNPVARQTLPATATTAQLTTALRNLGLIA